MVRIALRVAPSLLSKSVCFFSSEGRVKISSETQHGVARSLLD